MTAKCATQFRIALERHEVASPTQDLDDNAYSEAQFNNRGLLTPEQRHLDRTPGVLGHAPERACGGSTPLAPTASSSARRGYWNSRPCLA